MQRVYSELGYYTYIVFYEWTDNDETNEHSCAVGKHAQKHALN